MERMRLRVQTVPASDPVTHQEHTAYTVVLADSERLVCVPGWTLRDAIESFCKCFHVERETICIQRPFVPQSIYYYE